MAQTNRFGALAAVAGASLVAVGLVVIIMLVVEVHPAEATFPGKNGKMAFSGRQGEEWTIYTIKSTPPEGIGSNPQQQDARPRAFLLTQRQEDRQESC